MISLWLFNFPLVYAKLLDIQSLIMLVSYSFGAWGGVVVKALRY
jgi:hypothetical protein